MPSSSPRQRRAGRAQGSQGLVQGLAVVGLLAAVLVLVLEGPRARVDAISLESRISSMTRCPPLPPFDLDDCLFGVTRDHCGREVCAKGPGERCGGSFNAHGRCGEGMHCKCDRCVGCSTFTYTCDPGITACL